MFFQLKVKGKVEKKTFKKRPEAITQEIIILLFIDFATFFDLCMYNHISYMHHSIVAKQEYVNFRFKSQYVMWLWVVAFTHNNKNGYAGCEVI